MADITRLVSKNVVHCKYGECFWNGKEKGENFFKNNHLKIWIICKCLLYLHCQKEIIHLIKNKMENEERKQLERELETLKTLIEFHSTYGVIEDKNEYETMINDILDRMNEIKRKLKSE